MTRSQGSPARQRWPRRAAALIVALAMAAVFSLVLSQSWQQTAADQQRVGTQREGLAYLAAALHLVGALTTAQSAAVASDPVDPAPMRAALDALAAEDQSDGAALGTGTRWSDLRTQVEDLVRAPGRGRAAYDRFAQANALAADLVDSLVDSAGLQIDPVEGGYFLFDVVARRLVEVIVDVGAAVGAIALADAQPTGAGLVNLAVARNQVAVAAAQIDSDLRQSDRAATSSSLSAELAASQDTFHTAADAFAPPSVLTAQLPEIGQMPALASAAQPLLDAAQALSTATIDALDAQAAARQDTLAQQRRLLIVIGAAVFIGAVVLLCLLAPTRRQSELDPDDLVREPAPVPVEAAALMNARDILLEELVHVGRGVRARAHEDSDDAQ